MRLTECEMPLTNSPAFEQLSGKFTKALQVGGHSFSPDDRHRRSLLNLSPYIAGSSWSTMVAPQAELGAIQRTV